MIPRVISPLPLTPLFNGWSLMATLILNKPLRMLTQQILAICLIILRPIRSHSTYPRNKSG
jgi:hypothetical protein